MSIENLGDIEYRQHIIQNEILGEENRQRKEDSYIRSEFYNGRQQQYLLEALAREFSAKTVCDMRTVTSISLTNRIVNELSSVYKDGPAREFSNVPNDNIQTQIDNLYQMSAANVKLKQANRMLNLQKQCVIQTVPMDGKIAIRILQPHQYDVIPDSTNPEKAAAYIVNVFDRRFTIGSQFGETRSTARVALQDQQNQKIADPDDYQLGLMRFVWWTDQLNFITNGKGELISDPEDIENPLGFMPFIDVTEEKDFEYWVRCGCPIVDFDRDFGKILSDTANISRLQGYSQAIIYAESIPEDMVIGPNHVLRIPLDPNSTKDPRFEFVSPSPDLSASLNLLETYLRFFLASQNLEPGELTREGGKSFSSGIERLLAMIEKFDASRDDFDRFKYVEMQLFDHFRAWSNLFQGTDKLLPELQNGTIADDVEIMVNFAKPQAIQTRQEKQAVVIEQLEQGLMSPIEAIMELREVDEERAREILEEINGQTLGSSGAIDIEERSPNEGELEGNLRDGPAA